MEKVFSSLLIILGLSLFEIVNSVDNAIINAEVLSTMGKKARRWFLTWGIFSSVFLVRGLLPLLIVWIITPQLGLWGSFTAAMGSDPSVAEALELSAPFLLLAGGIFLIFVFFHWLFLEEKQFGLPGERFIAKQGVWFYAVVSILLSVIVWYAVHKDPLLAFSAVVGSTAFFLTHGFKEQAAKAEQTLMKKNISDVSKILYLEVIDATFSIDGVLGSFAYTLLVPLILIGNGLGAIVLRQMTIANVDRIRRYVYIKNGAMYSILSLGTIMVLDSFGVHIPHWISPLATFAIVGYFFLKSLKTNPVKK